MDYSSVDSGPQPISVGRVARELLWLAPVAAGVGLLVVDKGWPGSLLLLLPLLLRLAAWWRAGGRVGGLGLAAALLPALVLATALVPGLLVSVNAATSMARLESLLAGLAVYAIACTLRGWERTSALALLAGGLIAFAAVGLVMADWRGAVLLPLPAIYDHLPHLDLLLPGSGVLAGREDLNPRMVGGICAILLMPAVGLLRLARQVWLRALAIAAILAGGVTLALSQAPEALIGLFAGCVIFALAAGAARKWIMRLLTVAYFGLLALLAVPIVVGALNLTPLTAVTQWDSGDLRLPVEARLELWNRAFTMLADAPLVGVGLNNFPFVFHTGYQGFVMDDHTWSIAVSAHNGYLQAAADGGLAGLLVFAALLVSAYFWWRRSLHAGAMGTEKQIAAAALAGVAAFAGFNLVDSLTLGAKAAPAVWLLLGLLASSGAGTVQVVPTTAISAAVRRFAPPVALALLFVALAALALYWRPLYNNSAAVVAVRRAVAGDVTLGPDRPAERPADDAYIRAQEALTVALAANPTNVALLYQQGLLAYTFSDFTGATSAFGLFRLYGGVRVPASYYLGWSFFARGHDDEAVDAWVGTHSALALFAGGDALAVRNPGAAARAYRAADAAAPGHMEPLLRLGELQARSGDNAGAQAAFATLEQRFPQRADPYIAAAHADRAAGQNDAAIAVLQRGLANAAQPAWLLAYELSMAYDAAQNTTQALVYARQAAAAAPDNATVQNWLAELERR